jgi:hypothetical protein
MMTSIGSIFGVIFEVIFRAIFDAVLAEILMIPLFLQVSVTCWLLVFPDARGFRRPPKDFACLPTSSSVPQLRHSVKLWESAIQKRGTPNYPRRLLGIGA